MCSFAVAPLGGRDGRREVKPVHAGQKHQGDAAENQQERGAEVGLFQHKKRWRADHHERGKHP